MGKERASLESRLFVAYIGLVTNLLADKAAQYIRGYL